MLLDPSSDLEAEEPGGLAFAFAAVVAADILFRRGIFEELLYSH
jgi:hypothetical protein